MLRGAAWRYGRCRTHNNGDVSRHGDAAAGARVLLERVAGCWRAQAEMGRCSLELVLASDGQWRRFEVVPKS